MDLGVCPSRHSIWTHLGIMLIGAPTVLLCRCCVGVVSVLCPNLQAFANDGFIKVARGISCASIECCGNTFVYGDPAKYYEE